MPGDEELNCGGLKNAVAEAQRFIRDAEGVKGGTGENITRGIFFWPAIVQSYSNANEAIAAANSRKVHLFNIMNDRKCKGVGELVVQTTTILQKETKSSKENLAQELRDLGVFGCAVVERSCLLWKGVVGCRSGPFNGSGLCFLFSWSAPQPSFLSWL